MAKAKKLVLTNEWVEIKEMFEAGTNGCDDYGKNFEIGGELDILTKMNLWKERLWSVVENAGLLAPIAWKIDKATQDEIDRKVELEEAKWADEFDELDDYEPTDEELRKTEDPEFNSINLIGIE